MGVGINGTFTGTGVSAVATGTNIDVLIDIGGASSVDIEKQMPSGNWIKLETVTADYNEVHRGTTEISLRLNCTAFGSSTEYSLKPGA
jgi:hypothetical protein